jgi:hypothetical protein
MATSGRREAALRRLIRAEAGFEVFWIGMFGLSRALHVRSYELTSVVMFLLGIPILVMIALMLRKERQSGSRG